MLAFAACSTSGTQPPTDTSGTTSPQPGTTGTPSPDGGTSISSCGFVTSPRAFALPVIVDAPNSPFTSLGGAVACASGTNKLTSFLDDMNGDGILDLVVTTACADATVGVSTWLVYFGSASGFASTATRFALPPQSSAGCATVSIFDANGDLLPDYVVTSLCSDTTVGWSRWLVYPSTGTNCATTATPYPLPPGATPGAFATTGTTTASCGTSLNEPAFQLFDINGDGKYDFVVTQSCSDPTVGTSSWSVFLGTGTGASQTATSFPLPTSPTFTTNAFATTSGTASCSPTASTPQFGLIDFDADGKLDMMVTQVCNEPTVGTTAWLYYKNTGTAFAAAATIPLPQIPGAPTNSFPTLGAAGACTNTTGTPTYAVLDANGDGLPDVLVTRDCPDPLTGAAYWQLFANTGSEFASSYAAFALPAALGATSTALAGLTGTMQCTPLPARPTYTTTYLGGPAFDLVDTNDCTNTAVGATEWLVYSASCP